MVKIMSIAGGKLLSRVGSSGSGPVSPKLHATNHGLRHSQVDIKPREKNVTSHTSHALILVAISSLWLTTIHLGKEHVVQTLILVLMPSVFLVISLLFPSLPPPKKYLLIQSFFQEYNKSKKFVCTFQYPYLIHVTHKMWTSIIYNFSTNFHTFLMGVFIECRYQSVRQSWTHMGKKIAICINNNGIDGCVLFQSLRNISTF